MSDLWEDVKRGASLSVHPSSGAVLARLVWDGVPYTGSGPTSDTALRDLQAQVRQATKVEQSKPSTEAG